MRLERRQLSSGAVLQGDGIIAVCEGLRTPRLSYLDVSENSLGSEGIDALAAAIPRLASTHLRHLDLSGEPPASCLVSVRNSRLGHSVSREGYVASNSHNTDSASGDYASATCMRRVATSVGEDCL